MSTPGQSQANASNRVIRQLRKDINRLRKQYAAARSQIAALHMAHKPPLEIERWYENRNEEVKSPQTPTNVPVEPDPVDDNSIVKSEEAVTLEVGIQSNQGIDIESEELCTVALSQLPSTEDIPRNATSMGVSLNTESSIAVESTKETSFSSMAV